MDHLKRCKTSKRWFGCFVSTDSFFIHELDFPIQQGTHADIRQGGMSPSGKAFLG